MNNYKLLIPYRLYLLFIGMLTLLYSGCTPTQTTTQSTIGQPKPIPVRKVSENYGSIAVYDITIKHPTARLVYKSDNVRDRITRGLQESNGFRVIDWTRLQDVLFRRNLESSDLVIDAALRKEVGEILLNDYFLQGTITSFGERMEYASNAMSKQKTQVVDVELELFIKNALTNEVVASANGHGMTRKTITQTLGFGAAGGNDTVAAGKALGIAVDDAMNKLLVSMANVPKPKPKKAVATGKTPVEGTFLRQPDVKVLVILAETEEQVNGRSVKNANPDTFTSSTVEQALAKVFSDADYQVLTADDVLGKAYGVSGDENIILSGWINEQDIEAFENLLQARTGLASYAVKVGRMAHADIVVSGEVKYQQTETRGPGKVAAKTTNVILAAKALLVNKKKTYHISIVKNYFTAVLQAHSLKASETALIDAAAEAGAELLRHTPKISK